MKNNTNMFYMLCCFSFRSCCICCPVLRSKMSLENYYSGFENETYSSEELRRRLLIVLKPMQEDNIFSVWDTVIDLAGPIETPDGRTQWPNCVKEVVKLSHFRCRERIIWSGFCYHNGIPFGIMVAYAHFKKVLRDEAAYADLLNSWCATRKLKLDGMLNLKTYMRYIGTPMHERMRAKK